MEKSNQTCGEWKDRRSLHIYLAVIASPYCLSLQKAIKMSILLQLILLTVSHALLLSSPNYTSPTLLQQGILGTNSHCESVCSNVCDTEACILTCAERFCLQGEDSGIPWVYLVLALAILAVLTAVVKLVFEKMTPGRRMMDEGEAARYYHSL
jgi:hypothetical protein